MFNPNIVSSKKIALFSFMLAFLSMLNVLLAPQASASTRFWWRVSQEIQSNQWLRQNAGDWLPRQRPRNSASPVRIRGGEVELYTPSEIPTSRQCYAGYRAGQGGYTGQLPRGAAEMCRDLIQRSQGQ